MEIFTYIYEILFFAGGIYLFLFSTGRLTAKNPEQQEKLDEFRAAVNPYATILSALMIFFFGLNLVLHVLGSI